MHNYDDKVFTELVGKTITKLDEYSMECSDGTKMSWEHNQDCCEQTEVMPIRGDVESIMRSPITKATLEIGGDLSTNGEGTSTVFHFENKHGSVDIEWVVTSNGYYNESVDFWLKTA